MKISLRYILVSDDVRTEDNGKLMVIGLYGPQIIASTLPLAMPLAFTAGIVIEGEGKFELSGKLKHSGSDEELLTFGATGEAQSQEGITYECCGFGIQIHRPGTKGYC